MIPETGERLGCQKALREVSRTFAIQLLHCHVRSADVAGVCYARLPQTWRFKHLERECIWVRLLCSCLFVVCASSSLLIGLPKALRSRH